MLLLRIGVFESGLSESMKDMRDVRKGSFVSFFTRKDRLIRYLKCIGIGLPTWYVIGILSTFSNEFGRRWGSPKK